MGGELRKGDQCPKCKNHPLVVRFKTNAASQTRERFLACSGYSTGECRGFTWNLGSTGYTPSQSVLSQALVGARDVPGRPKLVKAVTAQEPADSAESSSTEPCVDLVDWLAKSRYLPVDLLLITLADVDVDLAARHRQLGSEKQAILRDVKVRIDVVE